MMSKRNHLRKHQLKPISNARTRIISDIHCRISTIMQDQEVVEWFFLTIITIMQHLVVASSIVYFLFLGRNANGEDNNAKTIDACTALHERWQAHHRTWFTSTLAEAEHKLLLADEGWRSARAK